jgi:hypothetical protein
MTKVWEVNDDTLKQMEQTIEKLTSQRNFWKALAERAAELLRISQCRTDDNYKRQEYAEKRDQWLKNAGFDR